MGALKSDRCSKGHSLKDPNLYYRKDGQRECLKCKAARNKEAEQVRKAKRLAEKPFREKKARKKRSPNKPKPEGWVKPLTIRKPSKPRKPQPLTIRQQILKRGKEDRQI